MAGKYRFIQLPIVRFDMKSFYSGNGMGWGRGPTQVETCVAVSKNAWPLWHSSSGVPQVSSGKDITSDLTILYNLLLGIK